MTWLRSSLVADRALGRQRRSCWPGVVPESRWQAGLRIIRRSGRSDWRAGGTAITVTCDVSDEDSVGSAIATTVETWGRLDVVVANAGVNGTWAGIEELAVEEFRSTLDINLVGTFTTIKYAVPHLRRRGGSVIVTSSVNGTRIFSNSGASAYSSSKAGQVALAKMLAVELGPDKIRVNVICPGAISTEIGDNTNVENDDVKIPVEYPEGNIPLTGGKSGSAEQVGELIAFLASDEASHISGTEIWTTVPNRCSGLT